MQTANANVSYHGASGLTVTVKTATCQDCVHYRTLYTKQANGSYKPMDVIAWCLGKEKDLSRHVIPNQRPASECKFFTPATPSEYRQLWVKIPG